MSSVGTAKLKAEDLVVSNILVDQAPTAKRVRFQSMGRVFRLRKKFCHLTVFVDGEPVKEAPKPTRAKKAKKAAVAEKKADDTAETEAKATAAKKTTKKTTKKAKAEKPVAVTTKKAKSKKVKIDNKTSDNEKKSGSDKKSDKA